MSASGSPGTHRFAVRIMQGMKVLAENHASFHVFEPAQTCDVKVHVIGHDKSWQARCLRLAEAGTPQAPIHVVPPLANTSCAKELDTRSPYSVCGAKTPNRVMF